jgi:PBP1b-binding outer membrane lipoprotein LpoB
MKKIALSFLITSAMILISCASTKPVHENVMDGTVSESETEVSPKPDIETTVKSPDPEIV